MTTTRILGALALAMTLPFAACDDDGTSAGEPGTMSVLLTDAPGDFLQAIVEIERVELMGDGVGATVLMDEPFTTDLLTLSNDFATLADEVVVPAGTYSQLRFIIPGACIEVEGEGGTTTIYATQGFDACEADAVPGFGTGALQTPSFDQTGIKVNLPGGATTIDGDQQIVILDFDVSESFGQQAGMSGMWVLDPTIKATDFGLTSTIVVELEDGQDSGLSGVGGSLADFQARLASEEGAVPFEDPDEDGVYTATFFFLTPGEIYDVSVELQEGFDYDFETSPETESVDLPFGVTEIVEFVLTSASASSTQ